MSLPLDGKRILVTREQDKATDFAKKITDLGGEPVQVPLINITCKRPINGDFAQQLSNCNWIFFTSGNGVSCFFQFVKHDAVALENVVQTKIAVVGNKTDHKLKEITGRSADFVPSSFDAETMAEEFLSQYPTDDHFLLVRGNLSRHVLPERFKQSNKTFTMLEVYETHKNVKVKPLLQCAITNTQIHYITFTSPSTVEAFVDLIGVRNVAPCVCIGTTTEQRAKELGFTKVLTAKDFTINGMIDCIKQDVMKRKDEKNDEHTDF
ncbi:uroporphyrinogen-III synthase [Virgibacillus sp. Bac330]|uniref:uroporphyrinogen-III synthase n=1 Tax=Virgibacillus sp. Bac330 TaxID=2419841 RepID=UPI000EF4F68F|nr:uroporphyrinogen-III synthase [Virgibacillus sp. Bac330]